MESPSRKEENAEHYAIESVGSKGGNLVSKRYRRKLEPTKTLILNIRRSRTRARCRELLLQNIHGSYNSIPKHITTLDEKYVLRCLELIRNCASRAASRNFTSKSDILPYDMSNLAKIKNVSSNNISGDWIIGSVSGSQSMINILSSPLLQKSGLLDFDVNCARKDLADIREPFCSDLVGPLQESGSALSCKLQTEVKVVDHKYVHKRDPSVSSTNSSCSDQSSSSAYSTSFQGMLQCTWRNGLPHHVFTVDDNKKEVYEANLSKVKSLDDKGLDYVYTFHSRRNCKKECDDKKLELESVAKMQVSTSITFSSNSNSEVRETRFVLSVSSDNHTGEVQSSNHMVKKNKRLTRKVVEVFKSNKQRSSSKLGGSSAIFEDAPWDPSDDGHNICRDSGEGCNENSYAPNLELAAIIVKDISKNHKETEVGGWGLKFLKKPGKSASIETSMPSGCSRNTGECSTSMDILIPARLHGGTRTRVGGPSSLIERWISGGRCDCGGWDIGCPLTILKTRSSNADHSSQADSFGPCKSVDLFVQGSKHNVPVMKMVNIHEGLYYIHIVSTLSSLQSFAVAAAIIHSHSPLLRS